MDALLSAALNLKARAAQENAGRAAAYDDGTLRAAEHARELNRLMDVAALEDRLVKGPILVLPLAHTRYQFNPQTLKPLGIHGTVYPTMRLTDDWGSLEVEAGGALVNGDTKVAAVSALGMDAVALRGDGWRLGLKPGWVVKSGSREGDFLVSPVGTSP